ncbi:hypothetical protein PGB90_004041 [Kerria lacca]
MVLKIFCVVCPQNKTSSEDAGWFFRKRYYLLLMLSFGMIMNVLLRANLSIAIVEMTSSTNITDGNVTYTQEPEFKWSSVNKGIILSSFSWGYFFSPLGGLLSSKYGGVNVFGVGILITSFLTFLTPILIRLNMILFIIGRMLEGVAESSAISGALQIFVNWIPLNERSRSAGIYGSGFYLGAAIAYPICGFTAYLCGWEIMFIITGFIALVWCIIWFIFFDTDPSTDKFISKKEKIFLSKNVVGALITKVEYPWNSIFMSTAVWAFFNERLIASWLTSFVIYCIPLYIKDLHNVTIDSIGLISALPNFCSFIGGIVGSFILDYIRNEKLMSNSKVCIHFTFEEGISVQNYKLKPIKKKFQVINIKSILPLDLSPHHASFLTGMSSAFSCIGYIINPIIMGFIVQNHTVIEWRKYFALLCGCNIWGIFIFSVFGSGEQQTWAIKKELKSSDVKENPEETIP